MEGGISLLENPTWQQHNKNAKRAGWDKWRETQCADLQLWEHLLPGHVAEFHKWLHSRHAPATVNNYMNPLRKANTWVKLYRPDEDRRNLFVRNVIRAKHTPRPDRFLMPDQLAIAVIKARECGEPALVTALMFGGLAGLDIQEILGLSSKDINDSVLHVRGTKNDFRPRIIPMVPVLAQYASAWKQCFCAMPVKTDGALSHKARFVLDECAREQNDETFKMVTLHEATRVTFTNMASQAGVDLEYLRAYIGHAPQSTLDKHYVSLTPRAEDMPRILTSKIEQLKSRVCDKVSKIVACTDFFA
jgi:hypothetical protein